MKTYEQSDRYREMGEKVIREREDLQWLETVGARIGYLTCDEEKHLDEMIVNAECVKVKDLYKVFVPYDFLVIVYEVNVAHMTEEQREILIYHELLHCDYSERKDGDICWKIKRHDIEDFSVILERYGLNWAQVGRNAETQQVESKEESIDG